MLPQKNNKRANAKNYRSEINAKVSRSVHIGRRNFPMIAILLHRQAYKCFKNLIPRCLFQAFPFVVRVETINQDPKGRDIDFVPGIKEVEGKGQPWKA